MPIDSRGNHIEVCLFESNLAKFFLENSQYFTSLYQKIFSAIDKIIAANIENAKFSRRLFSCESQVFSEYPEIKSYEELKNSQSLIFYDTYLKFFCETVLYSSDPIMLPKSSTQDSTTSVKFSAQFTLFGKSKQSVDSLEQYIRNAIIFKPSERGCIDVEEEDDTSSCKLGILQPEHTPQSLQNYFSEHFSAQFCYKPKEDSYVAKWLRRHYLPVISGTSGSAEKVFSQLSKFIKFTQEEAAALFLSLAVCMIALGHHSFFEVMLVADKVGLELQEQNALLAFYLQCVPQNIQESAKFEAFINNETGGKLLKNFSYQLNRTRMN